jgi:YVTN family beta-propeller protein
VNSANGKIYVANSGDGTVSVIDGKTDEAVATIQAGPHPYSVAANGATGKVYVSHTFSNKVTIIDGSTDTASNIEAGSFDLIAVNSKTNTIYMLGYEGGNLVSMDGTGLNVVRKTLGMHAWGMELNEATGKLYVARSGSAEVDIVTPGVLSQASVKTGAIPCAVAINPTTNMIYVANYGGNSVTVISGTTSTPLTTISVGVRPEAITVDPISNMVYVANTHSDTVTVIDGKQNKALNTLAAGRFPYALVVNPLSNKLHIMNLSDKAFTTVSLIPSRAD